MRRAGWFFSASSSSSMLGLSVPVASLPASVSRSDLSSDSLPVRALRKAPVRTIALATRCTASAMANQTQLPLAMPTTATTTRPANMNMTRGSRSGFMRDALPPVVDAKQGRGSDPLVTLASITADGCAVRRQHSVVRCRAVVRFQDHLAHARTLCRCGSRVDRDYVVAALVGDDGWVGV